MRLNFDGEEFEYTPYKDSLYREKMLEHLAQSSSFLRVFKVNLTDKFFEMLQKLVREDTLGYTQNTVINVWGDTGSGKSAIIFSLGLMFFKNFSHKNAFFHDQHILDNAHTFRRNTLIIRDENTQKGTFGQGSTRTAGQFSLLAETCRKAGLNLGLVEPGFIRNDITKWYLHTIDQDITHRVTRCGLVHPQTYRYMGAVCIPIMAETHPEWEAYNEIKDAFIEKMKRGDYGDTKINYESMAKAAMDDPDFAFYPRKNERRAYLIVKYPNLTGGEITTILNLIQVMERRG